MLAAGDVVVGLVDAATDRLIAFARALTDSVYFAMVFDVIVAAEHRGSGLGKELMQAVLARPKLAPVRSVELVCQPDLAGFYERFGFSTQVGASLLMRRTSDPLLTQAQPR